MTEFRRQSLKASIDAVRAARDELARAQSAVSEIGASRLGSLLGELAASEDRILHQLLQEDAKAGYRAGALPDAGTKPPAP